MSASSLADLELNRDFNGDEYDCEDEAKLVIFPDHFEIPLPNIEELPALVSECVPVPSCILKGNGGSRTVLCLAYHVFRCRGYPVIFFSLHAVLFCSPQGLMVVKAIVCMYWLLHLHKSVDSHLFKFVFFPCQEFSFRLKVFFFLNPLL